MKMAKLRVEKWKEEAPANCYACCTAALKEENETPELFGRSWRGRLSPLFWRVPILVWSVFIISWSTTYFWGPREMFLLYMTHWGLVLIFLESLFGIIVTVKKHRGSLPDDKVLPWYVRTYWVLYNITVPIAFLVTLFYWAVLRAPGKKINYAPNPILDIMLHGVNSGLMFVELVLSAHPSRLLHVMQPLYFSLAYLLFTVAYYISGGLDPWGNAFIYPVINWAKPIQTLVVVTLTALFLALMHILTVGIATARDFIARKCLMDRSGEYNDAFEA
ncbi:protein rolling stone-like [Maniola hyperantus]|uniref:protein rolling stone-like n=1 Tax=Aphantopus hyperantus TaxID=2795564 RepID=UPI001569FECF|nr:protein rolling stone-like [Maniola hyperantus]XP_034834754.1 protein rolling stone-like [Maniola hyperantus]XP_034834760.1 protein rolling stone-like [Maniola hyperantus]